MTIPANETQLLSGHCAMKESFCLWRLPIDSAALPCAKPNEGRAMGQTPIVDCHTHTHFSDGVATFEENVRAAAEHDCHVLVSTDHLTLPASMDPYKEVQVPEADLPAHRAAFEEARTLAADIAPNLTMVFGFECDWYVGCEPLVEKWSAGASVRLGSVHWIGDPGDIHATDPSAKADLPGTGVGWIDDKNDLHVWEELGADEVWRRYVNLWCRACESPLNFDVMAHPDLPTRFKNEGYAPTINLEPLWDQMATCAHDTGRRVELSTAAMHKTVHDYYPARGLLERFARADVPISVGSDAHHSEDICWGIRDAYAHAWDCGYRSIDVPDANGEWHSWPIE